MRLELGSRAEGIPEEPGELSTRATIEPFSNVSHNGHCRALHLVSQARVFSKIARLGYAVNLLRYFSSYFPSFNVFEHFYFAMIIQGCRLNVEL